jgi:hypothetical protein
MTFISLLLKIKRLNDREWAYPSIGVHQQVIKQTKVSTMSHLISKGLGRYEL